MQGTSLLNILHSTQTEQINKVLLLTSANHFHAILQINHFISFTNKIAYSLLSNRYFTANRKKIVMPYLFWTLFFIIAI